MFSLKPNSCPTKAIHRVQERLSQLSQKKHDREEQQADLQASLVYANNYTKYTRQKYAAANLGSHSMILIRRLAQE